MVVGTDVGGWVGVGPSTEEKDNIRNQTGELYSLSWGYCPVTPVMR